MNAKDGIRRRHQEKIRKLMEQQQASARAPQRWTPEPSRMEPVVSHMPELESDEPDPEKQWKRSPNPWLGWESKELPVIRNRWDSSDETDYPVNLTGGGGWNGFRKELKWKLAAAVLMFGAIWGMFQYDSSWSLEGRALVKNVLTEDMDFAAAAAWYKEIFAGAPSFIPIFDNKVEKEAELADGSVKLPVVSPLAGGAIVRTFAELLNGIELAGTSLEQVAAVETGRVLLVSEPSAAGITIVIEHADERSTVYGKLGQATVNVNDWVEAGDGIGTLLEAKGDEPSLLYFGVKQNDRFVDPVSVIPLD